MPPNIIVLLWFLVQISGSVTSTKLEPQNESSILSTKETPSSSLPSPSEIPLRDDLLAKRQLRVNYLDELSYYKPSRHDLPHMLPFTRSPSRPIFFSSTPPASSSSLWSLQNAGLTPPPKTVSKYSQFPESNSHNSNAKGRHISYFYKSYDKYKQRLQNSISLSENRREAKKLTAYKPLSKLWKEYIEAIKPTPAEIPKTAHPITIPPTSYEFQLPTESFHQPYVSELPRRAATTYIKSVEDDNYYWHVPGPPIVPTTPVPKHVVVDQIVPSVQEISHNFLISSEIPQNAFEHQEHPAPTKISQNSFRLSGSIQPSEFSQSYFSHSQSPQSFLINSYLPEGLIGHSDISHAELGSSGSYDSYVHAPQVQQKFYSPSPSKYSSFKPPKITYGGWKPIFPQPLPKPPIDHNALFISKEAAYQASGASNHPELDWPSAIEFEISPERYLRQAESRNISTTETPRSLDESQNVEFLLEKRKHKKVAAVPKMIAIRHENNPQKNKSILIIARPVPEMRDKTEEEVTKEIKNAIRHYAENKSSMGPPIRVCIPETPICIVLKSS